MVGKLRELYRVSEPSTILVVSRVQGWQRAKKASARMDEHACPHHASSKVTTDVSIVNIYTPSLRSRAMLIPPHAIIYIYRSLWLLEFLVSTDRRAAHGIVIYIPLPLYAWNTIEFASEHNFQVCLQGYTHSKTLSFLELTRSKLSPSFALVKRLKYPLLDSVRIQKHHKNINGIQQNYSSIIPT